MKIYRKLITPVILLALILTYGTTAYRLITHDSLFNCFYMTLITLTTVGYGEIICDPDKIVLIRVVTIFLIIFGMGLLLYVASSVTAFFVEGQLTNIIRRNKMDKKIAKLNNHFIVCGAGSTGLHVIRELVDTNRDFVVIEHSLEKIEKLDEENNILYVTGDATHDETLISAGIEKAAGLITVLSSDKDNLFVTVTARQLRPDIKVVTRGVESGVEKKLYRAGADAVVFPNMIGGLRIVSEMIRPTVVSFLDYMLRDRKHAYRFEEISIPDKSAIIGKTLAECNIPEKTGIPILAIKLPSSKSFDFYPDGNKILEKGASLVVMSDIEGLKKIKSLL